MLKSGLPAEDRYKMILQDKEDGNAWFKRGNFANAIRSYQRVFFLQCSSQGFFHDPSRKTGVKSASVKVFSRGSRWHTFLRRYSFYQLSDSTDKYQLC